MKNIEEIMQNPCHVYFIGIGGISMSGLAEILLTKGYTISGSDSKPSNVTKKLEADGAKVNYSQVSENITSDIDFVVYSAAIHNDNPERVRAHELGIPEMVRAELLGQIMSKYDTAISVSGTHGKTTTTSMISEVLLAAKSDPTILVGGILKSINGNIRIGKSSTLITEACEYTNSFLSFQSTLEVILNVREDHMDFFKDIDDIRNSFRLFTEKLDENGTLVINCEIDNPSYFTVGLKCKYVTFGSSADTNGLNPAVHYYPAELTYNKMACACFNVMKKSADSDAVCLGRLELKVPGDHNMLNALAAFASSEVLDIDVHHIITGLNSYTGTDRRFQYKGTFNGVTVVDDYAHHPDEIEATLTAAQKYPHNQIWCVFQPHTYTRTKAFMKEFAKALSIADNIVLAEIYPARETDTLGISSLNLAQEIEKLGKKVTFLKTFDEIETFLKKNCINDDLLITMGAGDVVLIGENLLKP